jgi:hypothetical protein
MDTTLPTVLELSFAWEPILLPSVFMSCFDPRCAAQDWHHFQDLAAAILADYDAGVIGEAEAEARFAPATFYFSLLNSMLLHHKPDMLHRFMATSRVPGESDAEAAARFRRTMVRLKERPQRTLQRKIGPQLA